MNENIKHFYNNNCYPAISKVAKVRLPGKIFEEASKRLGKKAISTPRILIVGCGVVSAAAISSQYPDAEIICALDISEKTIDKAKDKVSHSIAEKIHWVCADFSVEDISDILPEQQFDWIHCTGVLHHLEDPVRGIKNLSSLLKPDGIIRFQVYSRGARLWIEFLRQALLSHGLKDYKEATDWLKSLSKSHPFWFVLATYPESLKQAGFLDGFLNPQVKLFYADEWQNLFRKHNLSISFLERDAYIADAQQILPEDLFNTYNELDYFTKIYILETLGEWRADFSGFITKNNSIQEEDPLKRSEVQIIPVRENMSYARFTIWNDMKRALKTLKPDIKPHHLNYIVNNLFERQWNNGIKGTMLRVKWLSCNDRARNLASYDYIFRNNLDLLLSDISNSNYYQIPGYASWPEKQWLDGFYTWNIL